MQSDNDTNALLREIRDVLVAQHEKYKEYLVVSERLNDEHRKASDETIREYRDQFALHRRQARERMVAWMLWATVVIGALAYFGR
jgi:hypothetical protein